MNAFWILLLLILLSAFFALTEMALASARRARLQQAADEGDPRARQALAIKEHPSRFLAATQIGITATSLLAGIYGDSAMNAAIEQAITQRLPALEPWRSQIALAATITLVTALSIVFGEIIPKRIAIAEPEKVSLRCAPFMSLFIRMLSPAISFLSWSSDVILKRLPVRAAPAVTSVEDILAYVDESERSGQIGREESQLLGNVFRLDDRRAAAAMTPVIDVRYIDLTRPRDQNLSLLRDHPQRFFPVCKGDMQQIVGVVDSRELLPVALAGELDLTQLPMNPPLFVPGALTLMELLRRFRSHRSECAFVINEFGLTEGMVTVYDVVEAVVGDLMPYADDPEEALAVRRPDGSWLLDGLLPVDEMKEKLDIRELPDQGLGNYHTVAGFALMSFGRIPRKAERFDCAGWTFEVMDVDRNRVDQLLATPAKAAD
ncbi:MAG: hemolysin family protein [Moraxellaceae bacterium]|nr:hemolysin family protein [Moraxellaceae bacterium]